MGKKKQKLVLLEVTRKDYYGFEEGGINGWPTEKVIDEWFTTYDINSFHASREGSRFGNTSVIVSVKEVTNVEIEAAVIGYHERMDKAKESRAKEEEGKWGSIKKIQWVTH